jgi:hypothetical protein
MSGFSFAFWNRSPFAYEHHLSWNRQPVGMAGTYHLRYPWPFSNHLNNTFRYYMFEYIYMYIQVPMYCV